MQKANILGVTLQELATLMQEKFQQPSYRGSQIFYALFTQQVTDFTEMTTLPVDFRQRLAEIYNIGLPVIEKKLISQDGTIKYLWGLDDGARIESVLLFEGKRRTVCFSSQAGCPLGCKFCATGQGGFRRDLTVGEIVGQVLAICKDIGGRITNCVAMGQGEPLLNYDTVFKALSIINDPKALSIGWRHLTVSTCGVIPAIYRMADENRQCELAISLHAPDDKLRDSLIPINKKYPLSDLKEALLYYQKRTSRRVTLEYLLLQEVNDNLRFASSLVSFCRGLSCYINLIPYNPSPDSNFQRSSSNRISAFYHNLKQNGLEVCIRDERGGDIQAACGQLTQKHSLDEAGS